MFTEIGVSLFFVLYVLYRFWTRNYTYWQNRGVPSVPARFPFGNLQSVFLGRQHLGSVFDELYKKHKIDGLVGCYGPTQPFLLVTDVKLVKEVLIKNFAAFHDNGFRSGAKMDRICPSNPFVIKGIQRWKEYRGYLTGGLTSSKIKNMVPNIVKAAQTFLRCVSENTNTDVHIENLCLFFTIDSWAMNEFSIQSNSFKGETVFKNYSAFGNKIMSRLSWLSCLFFPGLADLLDTRALDAQALEFVGDVAETCAERRVAEGVMRDDILQHLLGINDKRKEEGKPEFTKDEFTALVAAYFADGTETVASLLAHVLYLLASHPDKQEILHNEILDTGMSLEDFDFDQLTTLDYLDSVIQETARMFPILLTVSRTCTQDTVLGSTPIDKGTKVFVPVTGLHYDPTIYPDPEAFKPERFLKGNRSAIPKEAFLGFGEGPRICPGVRVGSAMMKVAILALLPNFKLSVKPNASGLARDVSSPFISIPKEELQLRFKSY